ncbi:MAG TPA: hypothetical protein VGC05_16465, partial [Mycobacterium sp.]
IDQAVNVSFVGMPATTTNNGPTGPVSNNFLQMMQSWGPDPSAADFRNTCQFGSWSTDAGFTSAEAAMVTAGAGYHVSDRASYDATDGQDDPSTPPFVSVDGLQNTASSVGGVVNNGLSAFFSPSTSNELPYVNVPTGGSGNVEFQVESAASAPDLGCGNPTSAAGARCWLVVVPRGSHSGQLPSSGGLCVPSSQADGGFGTTSYAQVGSPLSTTCSYWDDRIVVPLDFAPTGSICPIGTPERGTNGSLLMADAMSSWLGAVCTGDNGTVFNLSTTAGTLTRQQVLQDTTNFAFLGLPLSAADDPSGSGSFASSDMRYAPVANAALTISFVIHFRKQVTSLKLSPRLVAKMLTQSYRNQIVGPPSPPEGYPTYLASVNPNCLFNDPEFAELNPDFGTLYRGSCDKPTSQIVETGPAGDDAIELLWRWIQADDAARKWLTGVPDENGMTINPYYLPTANPSHAGAGLPYDLSTDAVDLLPKADPTTFPDATTPNLAMYQNLQVDSIAWDQYSNDFGKSAQRILKGDSQMTTTTWDTTKTPAAFGLAAPGLDTVSPGQVLIGLTDSADAEQYGLSSASLQLPNQPGVFGDPTVSAMDQALSASGPPDALDKTIANIDFSKLAAGAYPLTIPLYAAVNLNSKTLDDTARAEYAHLMSFIATDGQIQGNSRGDLPPGYAPLTVAQAEQATMLAGFLDGSVNPNPPSETDDSPPVGTSESVSNNEIASSDVNGSPQVSPAISASEASATSSGTVAGGVALGGSLLIGLAGAIGSPFLLRRKELRP